MIAQAHANSDLRCTSCGYGVARLRPPERCPMCAGTRWLRYPQRHVGVVQLGDASDQQNGAGT